MALSQAQLSLNLQNLTPTGDESEAKETLAESYGNYMLDATASAVTISKTAIVSLGIPFSIASTTIINPGTTTTAANTIKSCLVGLWLNMAAFPASYFVGGTAVTIPPLLPTCNTLIEPVLISNQAGKLSLEDASDALAAVLHTATAGGTVTIGTIVTPIL